MPKQTPSHPADGSHHSGAAHPLSAASPPDTAVAPISRKRIFWFKVLSILLPFLLLFLLEIVLRVFGYGYDMRLFVEYPGDPRYLVLNPDASKLYFTDPLMAATGNNEPFKKEKDSNTCRIFVLGESTTIGYPYFHNGSFHRWLQYRLTHTFPEHRFEIVNLSVTATNSYTVLGFAKELVNYQPDAVLIYSGHNEYYGALGVGSASRLGGNRGLIRLMLWLRRLRLTQLLTRAWRGLSGLFHSGPHYSGETLMQVMAADQHIPYGSTLYHRGIDQFAENMGETLKLLSGRHIPVFISNLVSNEKDMQPFVNVEPDSNAAFYYRIGRLAYGAGDTLRARVNFSKAVDLDGLRFRAPSAINTIIDSLCRGTEGVYLVDTRSAFEARSEKGIPGNELLLEHVHPNLKGYALMSDAFYRALKREHFFSGFGNGDTTRGMTLEQLMQEMPVTTLDSMAGAYKIAKLKNSWPFNMAAAARDSSHASPPDSLPIVTREQRLAYEVGFGELRWQTAMDSLYQQYLVAGDLAREKTIMAAMTLEHPQTPFYFEQAANICGKLNDLEGAAFYFGQAFGLEPTFERARTLFVLYLGFDRPGDAMPFIGYALQTASDPRLNRVRQYTEQVIRADRAAGADPASRNAADSAVISLYVGMGNQTGARKRVREVLQRDPANRNALIWMSRLK